MRTIVLRSAALSLAIACYCPAEARWLRSTRTVQLIVMQAAGPPARVAVETSSSTAVDGPDLSLASEVEEPVPAVLRTHERSRRWVKFKADGFASFSAQAPAGERNPNPSAYAETRESRLFPTRNVQPPAPPIAIPRWMRAGIASVVTTPSFVPSCAASVYRPSGLLGLEAESRRRGYYATMSDIACEYGIPIGLFDALIIRESRYRANVFSAKNAFGLTQLMPGTAIGLGVDRYDVEQNLRGGARYLRQQLDRFGQVHLALAAYNAGPGRVRNGVLPRITETHAYVDNVLLNWRRLAGLSKVAPSQTASGAASPKRLQMLSRTATVATY